jgi:uncharacterized protein (TIGR02246 family)
MKRSTLLCGGALLALLLAGCAQTAPDTRAADEKALRDNEAQWNQDVAAKDLEKWVAHYAADAVLMGSGMPASVGTDAIRKTLKEMVDDPALSLKFQPSKVEVGKSGDIAYTQGSYTMTMTSPASKQVIHDHGSYVTTYRKDASGVWKAVADIASPEVPPPAPAAAHKAAHKAKKKK